MSATLAPCDSKDFRAAAAAAAIIPFYKSNGETNREVTDCIGQIRKAENLRFKSDEVLIEAKNDSGTSISKRILIKDLSSMIIFDFINADKESLYNAILTEKGEQDSVTSWYCVVPRPELDTELGQLLQNAPIILKHQATTTKTKLKGLMNSVDVLIDDESFTNCSAIIFEDSISILNENIDNEPRQFNFNLKETFNLKYNDRNLIIDGFDPGILLQFDNRDNRVTLKSESVASLKLLSEYFIIEKKKIYKNEPYNAYGVNISIFWHIMNLTVFWRGKEKKHSTIDTTIPMNKLNSPKLEDQSLLSYDRLSSLLRKINLLCIDRYDFSDTITYALLMYRQDIITGLLMSVDDPRQIITIYHLMVLIRSKKTIADLQKFRILKGIFGWLTFKKYTDLSKENLFERLIDMTMKSCEDIFETYSESSPNSHCIEKCLELQAIPSIRIYYGPMYSSFQDIAYVPTYYAGQVAELLMGEREDHEPITCSFVIANRGIYTQMFTNETFGLFFSSISKMSNILLSQVTYLAHKYFKDTNKQLRIKIFECQNSYTEFSNTPDAAAAPSTPHCEGRVLKFNLDNKTAIYEDTNMQIFPKRVFFFVDNKLVNGKFPIYLLLNDGTVPMFYLNSHVAALRLASLTNSINTAEK